MKKSVIAILLSTVFVVTMCVGCGAKEVEETPKVQGEVIEDADAEIQEDNTESEEVVAEEETQQEAVEEDSMENLSNVDWANAITLEIDKQTFVVFNNVTGERKVFEDGAEYTLLENDELGLITPLRWSHVSDEEGLYDTKEFKYNCIVYDLNYDMITENTEFTVTYNNLEGEPVTATIYLSK